MANKKVNKKVEVVEEATVNEEKTDENTEQIAIVSKKEKFIERVKPIAKRVGNIAKNILAGVGGLCVAAYVVGKVTSDNDMDSNEELNQNCYEGISPNLSDADETTEDWFTEPNTD